MRLIGSVNLTQFRSLRNGTRSDGNRRGAESVCGSLRKNRLVEQLMNFGGSISFPHRSGRCRNNIFSWLNF